MPNDMFLALAEGEGYGNGSMLEGLAEDPLENYLFVPGNVPGGGVWMNVANFTDWPAEKFNSFLEEIYPFQPNVQMDEGMGLFGGGKKKASRQEFKQQKQAAKIDKKNAKVAVIQGRAAKKVATAGSIEKGAATGIGGVLDKVGGIVGGIFGKEPGAANEARLPNFNVEGGINNDPTDSPPEEEKSFLQKYGLYIGLGVGALGLLYIATRKKK